MKSQDVQLGMLIQVTQEGTSHEGQYGIVLNNDGTPDYPNDYWIKFLGGNEAPYGAYEFEPVTMASLKIEEDRISQLRDYLECENREPFEVAK